MKMLLIIWAIGLARCDKLDRMYLPPPGRVTAGGYSGDLNLPFKFLKDSYPSTLEPSIDSLSDNGSLSSKYANSIFGINRQGSSEIAGIPISKNMYVIPSTPTSYNLNQKFTLLPVETYDTTVQSVTILPQGSSDDPNLTYDQYLIKQNMKPKKIHNPQSIPTFIPRNSVSSFPSFSSNVDKYMSGQLEKIGVPESQTPDFDYISTTNSVDIPDNFSKTIQYGGGLHNTSKVTIPTVNISYSDKYHNQQVFPTYSYQKATEISDDLNIGSNDLHDPSKTRFNATLDVYQTFVPSSEYPLTPVSYNDNFGIPYYTNVQPQRAHAENDRNADILNYKNIITSDGFEYNFDTSNGIHIDESGTANEGVKAKGSYSYIGDDGKIYSIEYVADENGFLPRGSHLPTAPPIPEAILRVIEEAEKNRKLGIVDDGSYDDGKYGYGRYEGLIGRSTQKGYKNIISNQPGIKENEKESNKTLIEKVRLPANKGEVLNTTKNETVSFNFPNKSNAIKADNTKRLLKLHDANQPHGNNLLNSEVENDEKLVSNTMPNRVSSSTDYYTNLETKYYPNNINQRFHQGYEYTQPQNKFNDEEKNSFTGITKYDQLNPEDVAQNERIAAKTFTTPYASFESKNQNPNTNSQILRKTFNDPTTTFGNIDSIEMQNGNGGDTKTDILPYNKGAGQIRDKDNIAQEIIFSTFEPQYASTTKKPYNYQSQSNENGEQRNNYPSSTLKTQYSLSTTPLPSEISSPFTLFTRTFSRSQATPTVSQTTSTFRPSITSKRPILEIPTRPSGYKDGISTLQQVENTRILPINPNSSGQRTTEMPVYQDRPMKIPVTQMGFSKDNKARFGASIDPTSKNLRVSSRPENFESQSSTEILIGEDFSGPKQPQRFDPQYGYYY